MISLDSVNSNGKQWNLVSVIQERSEILQLFHVDLSKEIYMVNMAKMCMTNMAKIFMANMDCNLQTYCSFPM